MFQEVKERICENGIPWIPAEVTIDIVVHL